MLLMIQKHVSKVSKLHKEVIKITNGERVGVKFYMERFRKVSFEKN